MVDQALRLVGLDTHEKRDEAREDLEKPKP
jgi:hypothetical protein